MKNVIKQNKNENSEYNNKIEAFNELDKMNVPFYLTYIPSAFLDAWFI